MTTVVGWIGCDSRAIASVNLATDSRVSWDKRGKVCWDRAQKTFSPVNSAEAFAYCGESLGMTQLISQGVSAIDAGYFGHDCAAGTNAVSDDVMIQWLEANYRSYPSEFSRESKVLRVIRDCQGMQSRFRGTVFVCDGDKKWHCESLILAQKSMPFVILGSGARALEKWLSRWERSEVAGTSRSIFSAFCDSVKSTDDPQTGGPPQLISLRRSGPAVRIGWTDGTRLYFAGTEILHFGGTGGEWRNSEFEECCPQTKQLKLGRQRQPRPRGLDFKDPQETPPPA
jgi:hypothetical protein